VCINYWLLSLLSLLGIAFIVFLAMLVIGIILINGRETSALAGSTDTYITFGYVVLTKQLLSLSLVLGSFAAFFLVAGQHPEDRNSFMREVVRTIRLALLAYYVYQEAKMSAKKWTDIQCSNAGEPI
jgi:hypothetical protein